MSRKPPLTIGCLPLVLALCLGLANTAICAGIEPPSRSESARIVVVQNSRATEAFKANSEIVKGMVNEGIKRFSSAATPKAAWQSICSPSDVVGIKVFSLPGTFSGTRKAVVEGVIEGLLAAGLPPTNVIVWDKSAADLRQAGFFELTREYGVRVESGTEAGYDYTAYYDSPLIGNLVWGDSDFGRNLEGLGRKSYVSRLLTEKITKIINVSPLLNHNVAGVSGNLYSLSMGSVDNAARFEYDPQRLAQAVPEIFALPWLSDKVVLNITDALICQYEGGERALLHYSVSPNELWISRDPVALDTLAFGEILRQRERFLNAVRKPNHALYANAALLDLGTNETNKMRIIRNNVNGQH